MNSLLFGILSPKTGRWSTIFHKNFGKDVTLMSRRVMDDPRLPNGTMMGTVATSLICQLHQACCLSFPVITKIERRYAFSI